MDFNLELTDFPSVMHEKIYSCARQLMPLLNHNAIAEPIRESWLALHGFMMDKLADMYDFPDKYKLPYGKLEKFLDDRDIHDVKREAMVKLKSINSETTHAVTKHMATLKQTISENHPEMRLAMEAMPHWNGVMCDYRSIAPKYKPTHDDYFAILFKVQRELAYELHHFITVRKIRISTSANWGVLYHYKGKHVITIKTGEDNSIGLSVRIAGKDKTDDAAALDAALKKEPQDFQEKALGLLSGCDANRCISCSSYSSGRYVTILGKQHQMCGEGVISYIIDKPISDDMTIIKRLVDMRCESIDGIRGDATL